MGTAPRKVFSDSRSRWFKRNHLQSNLWPYYRRKASASDYRQILSGSHTFQGIPEPTQDIGRTTLAQTSKRGAITPTSQSKSTASTVGKAPITESGTVARSPNTMKAQSGLDVWFKALPALGCCQQLAASLLSSARKSKIRGGSTDLFPRAQTKRRLLGQLSLPGRLHLARPSAIQQKF